MPRRTASSAFKATDTALRVRWLYLVRNSHFQEDLRRLFELANAVAGAWRAVREARPADAEELKAHHQVLERTQKAYQQNAERVRVKWGLQWLPVQAVTDVPKWSQPGGISHLDALWDMEASPEGTKNFEAIFPPIVLSKRLHSRLQLEVAIDQPLDVILAALEAEVRYWLGHRSRKGPRRQRADTAAFTLRVYDASRAGKTFADIARVERRPVSTVKSAYVAARRRIGMEATPRKRDAVATEIDPKTFDPKHYQSCPDCRAAKTWEQMCVTIRAWTDPHRRARSQARR